MNTQGYTLLRTIFYLLSPDFRGCNCKIFSWLKGLLTWCCIGIGWCREYGDTGDIIIKKDWSDLRAEAVSVFVDATPEKFQEIASSYQYGWQLPVLRMLKHYPDSYDFALNAPLLFGLMVERYGGLEAADSCNFDLLIKKKRQYLLCWLGYEGSKSMLRFLRKINLDWYGEEDFVAIKKILDNPKLLKTLRHFPEIGRLHLTVAEKYPDLFQCKFFRRAILDHTIGLSNLFSVWRIYRDIIQLGVILRKAGIHSTIARFRSVKQLNKLHDSWSQELNRQKATAHHNKLLRKYGEFPKTPIPGNDDIVPITSLNELVAEGKKMKNCLASYGERIYKKQSFVYRVLKPQRASLEINLLNKPATINQLKLFRNREPNAQTREFVMNWLQENQKQQMSSCALDQKYNSDTCDNG